MQVALRSDSESRLVRFSVVGSKFDPRCSDNNGAILNAIDCAQLVPWLCCCGLSVESCFMLSICLCLCSLPHSNHWRWNLIIFRMVFSYLVVLLIIT